jgi:hypothetical protein
MINKNSIINAYIFLRENNQSIPSEVLEFMKEASLEKLKNSNNEEKLSEK